ncbi:MAG: PIG-L deacetylase family protein [Planctomycetota bacterium]
MTPREPEPLRRLSRHPEYVRGRVDAMQDFVRHLAHHQTPELPPTARPLFLAPHPDDIIIGCGGTLKKLLAAAVPVRLIYLTDGREATLDPAQQTAMAAARAAEAAAVSDMLGLPPPTMLGWPEGSFRDPAHLEERAGQLRALLESFEPDGVFLPYLFDQNADHRFCNHLLARALTLSSRRPAIYGYEVLTIIPPGMAIDITDQLEGKQELLGCYPSQLALFPYQQMVDVVDRQHASLVGGNCRAAEVFCQFAGEAYLEVIGSLDLAHPDALTGEVRTTPPDTW